MEDGGGHDQHRHVDEPGDRHRDHDVDLLEAEDAPALVGIRADHAPLRQRRMQVDHVRHHGRAQDSRGQEHALGVGELRRQQPLHGRGAVGVRVEDLEREAGHDDADEHRDDRFEVAHAAQLGAEDGERDQTGEQAGGEQRHAEEQVEAEGGADELRQVARHRDRLRLQPEEDAHRLRERLAADLGEVVARGDAELRAHRLDQHGHQVRDQDDPEQHVAVLGAGRDVGGEVAGVDVRDRRDEGGPQEGPQASQPSAALGQRALRRLEYLLLAGQSDGRQIGAHGRRWVHALPPMRMRSASSREIAWRSPATSTVRGPSKGACASMTTRSSGRKPSSAR